MPELQEATARREVGYLHWLHGWRLRHELRNSAKLILS